MHSTLRAEETLCPENRTPVDVRLLIKVSKLYFEQHLTTQQEIPEHLYLSRLKVFRLLRQAHDRGIIKITIVTPQGSHTDLSNSSKIASVATRRSWSRLSATHPRP